MDSNTSTLPKRSHDSSGDSSDAKRFRPDEILGSPGDDRVITRLLMSRLEFSKLIGKGGSTISHIRSTSGVNCRGTNMEDDSRLVLIVGPFHNVMRAFDMITEVLNNGTNMDHGVFSVSVLLEHSKAGKIVGAKGATIQRIQSESGCGNIRIEKEPKEYSDVQLRKLAIEGTLSAVRRAHYMVHDLYAQDALYSASKASGNAYPHGLQGQGAYSNQFAAQPHTGMQMSNPGFSQSPEGALPFPSLVQHGVQRETVVQLSEMKGYLSRHFGLNLSIFKEGAVINKPQAIPTMAPYKPPASPEKLSLEDTISLRKQKAPAHQEMCFGVPKHYVGGIIGKSGNILKTLQSEYNVRVHVEKENYGGDKRLVVLSAVVGVEAIADDNEKINAFLRCHQRILAIIQEQEQTAAANVVDHGEAHM